jgi:hypothetical protein
MVNCDIQIRIRAYLICFHPYLFCFPFLPLVPFPVRSFPLPTALRPPGCAHRDPRRSLPRHQRQRRPHHGGRRHLREAQGHAHALHARLHAARHECMRLFPPVQFESKFAVGDDMLPGWHVRVCCQTHPGDLPCVCHGLHGIHVGP